MADKEYIERDAALDDIDAAMKNSGMGYIAGQVMKRYIKRVPAADVAPVVHAHWCYDSENGVYNCSRCGNAETSDGRYCSYCGAKMDGGKHDV